MRIHERRLQETTVLDLYGALTSPDASELLVATIREVIRNGQQRIVLHLGEVASIDAGGLGALVAAYGLVGRSGGTLKLARVASRVYTLLVVCRLASEFETFDSVEAAVANGARAGPSTTGSWARQTQTSLDVIHHFLQRARGGAMIAPSHSLRTVRGPQVLDRWLRVFAEVRDGEGAGALLLAANVFCLLGSYYLLKTVREALILSEGGAEVKSYAAGAQALMLLLLVPAYGAFASRVNRIRLINGVTLFFVSHLVVFHQLAAHGVRIGVAFFLWVGIFNLMAVAQFWAFANDLYAHERGERLFPLVGVGASLGAWVGARVASRLMTAHTGPTQLLLVAAVGLLLCVALAHGVNRRERAQPSSARRIDEPLGAAGGFRLVLGDRYLRLIATMVILLNMVNTIGEFLLGKLVVAHASRALADGTAAGLTKSQVIGIFYGDFFGWVNLVSLGIQLFVVSRVFKRVGVRGALFVLPLVAFVSYGVLALVPVLAAVRIGKIFENSTDYSLQNTARHALFLTTSREAKYKAKQAIDAFCWRTGDVLQAIVIYAGVHFSLGVPQFAVLNQVLVVTWLAVIVGLYREHKRRLAVAEPTRTAA